MSTREELLAEIDAFLERHGIAPTRFGKDVLRDPSFVMRLRLGNHARSDTIDRVKNYMRHYKPRPSKRLSVGAAA